MNKIVKLTLLCISILAFCLSTLDAAPSKNKKKRSNKQKIPRHIPAAPTNSDRKSWGIKSGFFVGAGIGAGMMLFSTPNMNKGSKCANQTCRATDSVLTLDYTAKLGFQHYFTIHQGMRIYASYTGGSGFPSGVEGITLYYMNNSADFNLDYLLELAQTKRQAFGTVLGVYVGYSNFYRSQEGSYTVNSKPLSAGTDSLGGLMAGINVGVGYTFLRHHRFDVTAKIPLLSLYNVAGIYRGNIYIDNSSHGANWTDDIYYRYASVNVSYNFIF